MLMHCLHFVVIKNCLNLHHASASINIFYIRGWEPFASMALAWKHPFTSLVAGPTGCGKTYFVIKFLKCIDTMIDLPPHRILWCYGEYQPIFNDVLKQCPHVEFVEGFPESLQDMMNPQERTLVIIDDLMSEVSGNKNLASIFTKGSHHRNCSVVLIQQNIFYQGKESRTVSLNCQYLTIFKSPRDVHQVSVLGRQIYPQSKHFMEAFNDATKNPFTYLLIDLKPETPDDLRLRACIFPGEKQYVYSKKV